MSTDMALWRSGLLKVIQPIEPSRSAITRLVLLSKAMSPSSCSDAAYGPAGRASLLADRQPVLILEIVQPRVVAQMEAVALGVDLVQVVGVVAEEGEEVLEQVARLDVGLAVLELDDADR